MRALDISVSELKGQIVRKGTVFFCSASFEARCTSAPLAMEPDRFDKVFVFQNASRGRLSDKNRTAILKYFAFNSELVLISKDDPSITAEAFSRVMHSIDSEYVKDIFIDITCFTRESLLILFRIMKYRISVSCKLTLLYNLASSYGGKPEGSSGWLSRGVADIRPVIGYSGELISSKNVHLVVVCGYELDRLHVLFETIVPSKVTILRSENTLAESHQSRLLRSKTIQNARRRYGSAQELVFAPFSLLDAFTKLDNLVKADQGQYSTSVAPLSTKVSTVSIGLYALLNESIQIVYTKPGMYNRKSYSLPSESIKMYKFTLGEIEQFFSENISA